MSLLTPKLAAEKELFNIKKFKIVLNKNKAHFVSDGLFVFGSLKERAICLLSVCFLLFNKTGFGIHSRFSFSYSIPMIIFTLRKHRNQHIKSMDPTETEIVERSSKAAIYFTES